MTKTVKTTLAGALRRPLPSGQLASLKAQGDAGIDFSEAPEITTADITSGRVRIVSRGGARAGAGRKPAGRVPMTLRVRPEVAARLRAEAKRLGKSISEVAEPHLAAV